MASIRLAAWPPMMSLIRYHHLSASMGLVSTPTSTTVPALGCVEVVQSIVGAPASPALAASSLALCLYRFGIMLAANALARHYWPHMPVATAYEQLMQICCCVMRSAATDPSIEADPDPAQN